MAMATFEVDAGGWEDLLAVLSGYVQQTRDYSVSK